MTDLPTARQRMLDFLHRSATRMDAFGSALPQYKNRPKHELVIVEEREYDFGWTFFWNTKKFVETGDHKYGLIGNAPIIVDRTDGKLYVTGTAHPLDHYLAEYRRGLRHPA
jgi:hypothetical protein